MTNSNTSVGDIVNAGAMFSDFFFWGTILLFGLLFLVLVVSLVFRVIGKEPPEFLCDQDDLFVDEREL
jgi:hypothetical protein